jgi:hypothetical protein
MGTAGTVKVTVTVTIVLLTTVTDDQSLNDNEIIVYHEPMS